MRACACVCVPPYSTTQYSTQVVTDSDSLQTDDPTVQAFRVPPAVTTLMRSTNCQMTSSVTATNYKQRQNFIIKATMYLVLCSELSF